MGDLSTHKQIFTGVVYPLLRNSLSLTKADVQCFELGNWLRDVSQFRDPYAFQLKKIELFEPFRDQVTSIRKDAKTLLNELFGPHHQYDSGQNIVAGALGEWFRQMLLALGVYTFKSAGIALGDHIPESDFLRIFSLHFTQYYPHEHLDFPPTG